MSRNALCFRVGTFVRDEWLFYVLQYNGDNAAQAVRREQQQQRTTL